MSTGGVPQSFSGKDRAYRSLLGAEKRHFTPQKRFIIIISVSKVLSLLSVGTQLCLILLGVLLPPPSLNRVVTCMKK